MRFTQDEAATFLNDVMGLALSPEDIAALEARTEGWIAGLQMAALSMRGRDDISGFIQSFTGSHRYVIDYLMEEVLERQTPEVQSFLLKTSILDRLTGDLCDAVVNNQLSVGSQQMTDYRSLSTGNAQAILETLEQNNLFLIPLDDQRRWYRYHHLFADLLRNHLYQTSSDEVAHLHQRAVEGLLRKAITQGLEVDYALKLLAEIGDEAKSISPQAALGSPLVESLSQRELEVLRLLVTNLSAPEIADELVVSASTVRSHIKNIYSKLDAHSRHEPVTKAKDLGIL